MHFAQSPLSEFRTKRPGDLRKHYLRRHNEIIVIPRRRRRTDAEIVVKPLVVTQELDNYNSVHVTCASPVVIAPTPVELAVQDRFAEQVLAFQTSYKVCTSLSIQTSVLKYVDQPTLQDFPSFDWLTPHVGGSPSPSPISISTSSTPSDSVSTPFDSPGWFMGGFGLSESHLLPPSDPWSPMHWPQWDTFTFGIQPRLMNYGLENNLLATGHSFAT